MSFPYDRIEQVYKVKGLNMIMVQAETVPVNARLDFHEAQMMD